MFSVFLPDTRISGNGATTVGALRENGAPVAIDGYAEVSKGATVSARKTFAGLDEAPLAGGMARKASTLAAAPRDAAQPKVPGIEKRGDGFVLPVEDIPGHLRIHGGSTPATDEFTTAAETVEGDGTGVREIAVPPAGAAGFYRPVLSR